jgi:hypothetical protein
VGHKDACIVLKSRCIRIPAPKGGEERAFDLILSRPMLRVLWRARNASRRDHAANAKTWVFAGEKGHIRGDHLTKLGVASNHALRRAYASEGRAAGLPKDSIRRFLNHSGGDITDHDIRDRHRLLHGARSSIDLVQGFRSAPTPLRRGGYYVTFGPLVSEATFRCLVCRAKFSHVIGVVRAGFLASG